MAKRGGKRPGAGRPRGSLEASTKARLAAKQAFLERVAKVADRLFNAQFALATGVQILFRVDKDEKGRQKPAVQVTDEGEIEKYLNGDFERDDSSYYFIATQKPDNAAIRDMLDRSFGRPEEKLDLTSAGRRIESPIIISKIAPRKRDDGVKVKT